MKRPGPDAREKAAKWLDEQSRKSAAAIAAARVPTEAEMRAADAAHPKTLAELTEEIRRLTDRPHDYGTCVYAMSYAAAAAFNYVSSVLGVTGFQASCADLDVLRLTRGLKHGFMIINAADLLYPQYDVRGSVEKWIAETLPTLAAEARKLLESSEGAHPDVVAHWRKLAELGQ